MKLDLGPPAPGQPAWTSPEGAATLQAGFQAALDVLQASDLAFAAALTSHGPEGPDRPGSLSPDREGFLSPDGQAASLDPQVSQGFASGPASGADSGPDGQAGALGQGEASNAEQPGLLGSRSSSSNSVVISAGENVITGGYGAAEPPEQQQQVAAEEGWWQWSNARNQRIRPDDGEIQAEDEQLDHGIVTVLPQQQQGRATLDDQAALAGLGISGASPSVNPGLTVGRQPGQLGGLSRLTRLVLRLDRVLVDGESAMKPAGAAVALFEVLPEPFELQVLWQLVLG